MEPQFKRFNALPVELRRTIWKYLLPKGRVIDVVFDRDRDRYYSFHSVVPVVLYACQESRTVALSVYTLCFATQSNPAAIPINQILDCILFEDWLTPPPISLPQGLTSSDEEYLGCKAELQRLIGPIGPTEQYIRRVAISIDFYAVFGYTEFVESLRYLFRKLPKLDTLVFVLEERDPRVQGEVYFSELDIKAFCCPDCYYDIKSYIGTALQEAQILSEDATVKGGDEILPTPSSDDFSRTRPKDIQLRFRGIYRGGKLQPIKPIERCARSGEDEILQP